MWFKVPFEPHSEFINRVCVVWHHDNFTDLWWNLCPFHTWAYLWGMNGRCQNVKYLFTLQTFNIYIFDNYMSPAKLKKYWSVLYTVIIFTNYFNLNKNKIIFLVIYGILKINYFDFCIFLVMTPNSRKIWIWTEWYRNIS